MRTGSWENGRENWGSGIEPGTWTADGQAPGGRDGRGSAERGGPGPRRAGCAGSRRSEDEGWIFGRGWLCLELGLRRREVGLRNGLVVLGAGASRTGAGLRNGLVVLGAGARMTRAGTSESAGLDREPELGRPELGVRLGVGPDRGLGGGGEAGARRGGLAGSGWTFGGACFGLRRGVVRGASSRCPVFGEW